MNSVACRGFVKAIKSKPILSSPYLSLEDQLFTDLHFFAQTYPMFLSSCEENTFLPMIDGVQFLHGNHQLEPSPIPDIQSLSACSYLLRPGLDTTAAKSMRMR